MPQDCRHCLCCAKTCLRQAFLQCSMVVRRWRSCASSCCSCVFSRCSSRLYSCSISRIRCCSCWARVDRRTRLLRSEPWSLSPSTLSMRIQETKLSRKSFYHRYFEEPIKMSDHAVLKVIKRWMDWSFEWNQWINQPKNYSINQSSDRLMHWLSDKYSTWLIILVYVCDLDSFSFSLFDKCWRLPIVERASVWVEISRSTTSSSKAVRLKVAISETSMSRFSRMTQTEQTDETKSFLKK